MFNVWWGFMYSCQLWLSGKDGICIRNILPVFNWLISKHQRTDLPGNYWCHLLTEIESLKHIILNVEGLPAARQNVKVLCGHSMRYKTVCVSGLRHK